MDKLFGLIEWIRDENNAIEDVMAYLLSYGLPVDPVISIHKLVEPFMYYFVFKRTYRPNRNEVYQDFNTLYPEADDNSIRKMVDGVLNLYNLVPNAECSQLESNEVWRGDMTVGDMLKYRDGLPNFGRILKKAFPTVRNYEWVSTLERGYFFFLRTLKSRKSIASLRNYMAYQVMRRMYPLVTGEKSDICRNLSHVCPYLAARTYIESRRITPDYLERAKEMDRQIKEQIRQQIEYSEWLDEVSKEQAILKLDRIKSIIGYAKWIMNDTELAARTLVYFNSGEDIFDVAMQALKKSAEFKSFRLHRSRNLEYDWVLDLKIYNAYYQFRSNTIYFGAGRMDSYLFRPTLPKYLHYGSVGRVLGHEIGHGFDKRGVNYNYNGSYVSWMSDGSQNEFERRANELIRVYTKNCASSTSACPNYSYTIGEDISDQIGITAAYNAYKSLNLEEEILPNFDEWTSEQMFFLSYANSMCGRIYSSSSPPASSSSSSNQIVDKANALIDQEEVPFAQLAQCFPKVPNTHSPYRSRVNTVFANFDKFALAFGCRSGSRMNPKHKVTVW